MPENVPSSKFRFNQVRIALRVYIYIQLFLLQALAFSLVHGDSKSSYFLSKERHVKEGKTMRTTEVIDVVSCKLLCLHEQQCYTINFKRRPDDKSNLHRCELFDVFELGKILPSDQFDVYIKWETLTSCSHAKSLGYEESKYYVIDPDGKYGEIQPFRVYCNMTLLNGVTVISHDSEAKTLVRGCEPAGCYRRDVVYDGISNLQQLRALTSISTHCRQWIQYLCYNSIIWNSGKLQAWLVSRDGDQLSYWGGATRDSRKCACGVKGTCPSGLACNCDVNDNAWREDSGMLSYKEDLPITSLRFGDTGNMHERGYHVLGKLECYGQEE